MSTLKLEHIANINNAGPDVSIDTSGHLNVVNGGVQVGGTTVIHNTGAMNPPSNILATSNSIFGRNTSDGADTGYVAVVGGGAESDGRGAIIRYYGNEHASSAGLLALSSGNINGAKISLRAAGTNVAYVTSTGLGIGTDSPIQKLQVTGNAFIGANGTPINNSSYDSGLDYLQVGRGIIFQAGTDSQGFFKSNHYWNGSGHSYLNTSHGSTTIRFNENNDGIIQFETAPASSTATTPRVTIRNNGNVGIGTTNPTSKLHTDGAIVSTNLAQGSGELQIQGYGNTGYINMNGSGSLIFRMGSSYSQDLKLTSAGILQGSSDAEIKTSPIRKHSNTISTNTTIDSSENAIASGPIGVATGVTLTINGNMTVV